MTRLYVFEWRLSMRNDRMGFAKNLTVRSHDLHGAVVNARGKLTKLGYNAAEFECIEARRGAIVS